MSPSHLRVLLKRDVVCKSRTELVWTHETETLLRFLCNIKTKHSWIGYINNLFPRISVMPNRIYPIPISVLTSAGQSIFAECYKH